MLSHHNTSEFTIIRVSSLSGFLHHLFFFLVRFRFISSSFCILCPTSYLSCLFLSCFCCFSLRLKFIRYFTSEHDIFAYHLSSRLVYLHPLIIIFSLSPHSPAISQHLLARHSFVAPILLFTSSRYMCPIFYFNRLWLLHVVCISIYLLSSSLFFIIHFS